MMDVAREEIRGEKPKTLKTPSQIKKTREKWAAAKRKQREKQTDEMKKENKIKALIRQMRNLDADDLKRVIDSTVTQKKPKKILTELSVYVSPKPHAKAETCATVTSESRLTVKHLSRKGKKTMAKKKQVCSFLAKKKNSACFWIPLDISSRAWVRMKKDHDIKKKGNSTEILKCLKFYNDSTISIPGKRFKSYPAAPAATSVTGSDPAVPAATSVTDSDPAVPVCSGPEVDSYHHEEWTYDIK